MLSLILLLLFHQQNNGEYNITVHISPYGMIMTSAHDSPIMGVVTLLLPSAGPQTFEHTIQLYSTDRRRNVSCIHETISVPGPWLNEYQDGPGIEKPIRKLRPKGQYHWCTRYDGKFCTRSTNSTTVLKSTCTADQSQKAIDKAYFRLLSGLTLLLKPQSGY